MPPEWGPQEAVWIAWPLNPDLWPGRAEAIGEAFAKMATALSQFTEVRVLAAPEAHPSILRTLRQVGADCDRVALFPIPTNDVWCRDHGPTFIRHQETGELAMVDWSYNAWGAKFPPWDLDDAVPRELAGILRTARYPAPMVCEGGAIEVNGEGCLLTTESVLLNPNRNPNLSRLEVEEILRAFLGVRSIGWLGSGLVTDDTDGHIDTLARFWKPDGVVAVRESRPRDPDYRPLMENWERLQGFRTPEGSRLDLVPLPQPDPVLAEGTRTERLPATYANFLIVNHGVLVPTYGQPRADDQALGILRELFPNRSVVGLDSCLLLREGGSFHCVTQQQPAGRCGSAPGPPREKP